MSEQPDYYLQCSEIAEIAKALSHPARVYIMKKLSGLNSCCYSGDLFNELPIARSTVSQHLKELKLADLIKGETEAPYIKYCVNREKWEHTKKLFSELLNL